MMIGIVAHQNEQDVLHEISANQPSTSGSSDAKRKITLKNDTPKDTPQKRVKISEDPGESLQPQLAIKKLDDGDKVIVNKKGMKMCMLCRHVVAISKWNQHQSNFHSRRSSPRLSQKPKRS